MFIKSQADECVMPLDHAALGLKCGIEIHQQLEGVKWSGSTLRFTPAKPLPDTLVRTVIEARVEQNRGRA